MADDDGAVGRREESRPPGQGGRTAAERKSVLLRLDPAVHEALQRWAADELRSVNAQIEIVLRESLRSAGRAPRRAGPLPRRGRPPRDASA
ncbi:MAG TPA: hypothetical protein VK045_08420 [Ornithinicoccus sp.]|nr:hypothetical protein [Ornithinicoccus sp.]